MYIAYFETNGRGFQVLGVCWEEFVPKGGWVEGNFYTEVQVLGEFSTCYEAWKSICLDEMKYNFISREDSPLNEILAKDWDRPGSVVTARTFAST